MNGPLSQGFAVAQAQLYQFFISHYCEKTRWALDYKGIPFRTVNLLPAFHLWTTRRKATRSSVPILGYEGSHIQHSTAILEFLEIEYPKPRLIPKDHQEEAQALEWEEYCDEEIGKHLRRYFYHYLLDEPQLMPRLLTLQASWYQRLLFTLAFPGVKRLMRKAMRIYPERAKQSRQHLQSALEKLESTLKKRDFLVGKNFSRADLSAAALLAPLFNPPEHEFPWPAVEALPKPLRDFRKPWEDSRVHRYVLRMYRDHRRRGVS